MVTKTAEARLRAEIAICRNCEICEDMLENSCLVFPELFRIVKKVRGTGEFINDSDLMHIINLCNFCAQCPCPSFRSAIIDAKTEYMETYGLSVQIKAIEDVERICKIGGTFPKLTNAFLNNSHSRKFLEKTVGIHRKRKIPSFPRKSFSQWLKKRKSAGGKRRKNSRKVAYFSGCTANYLFPDVPKAVVGVLERAGIEVCFPDQTCCGMPSLLEGDKQLTLKCVRYNLLHLSEAVSKGYDIVCSCPTCGFMLKSILQEGARYSSRYNSSGELSRTGNGTSPARVYGNPINPENGLLKSLLNDNGYFSSLDPNIRIHVATHTYDLGEYLRLLEDEGAITLPMGRIPARVVYFPPCHQQELKIGEPYVQLLSQIPGVDLDKPDGSYCCGNAGIMGFKQQFHLPSIKIGSRLMAWIKNVDPDIIATDCLSCRMQFNQLTPYNVLHPIQMLCQAYEFGQMEERCTA